MVGVRATIFSVLMLLPLRASAQNSTRDAPALEQPPGEPNDDGRGNKADELFAAGRYSEAAQEYERLDSAAPSPELRFRIAEARRLEGDRRAALLSYQLYLKLAPNGLHAAEAQARIDAILQEEKPVPPPRRAPDPIKCVENWRCPADLVCSNGTCVRPVKRERIVEEKKAPEPARRPLLLIAAYGGYASISDDSWAQADKGSAMNILPMEGTGAIWGLRALVFDAAYPHVMVGIAFDSAAATGDAGNLSITRFTPTIQFGLPLWANEHIPAGRVRPYAALGLSIVKGSFTPIPELVDLFLRPDAQVFGFGAEIETGLAFQPTTHALTFVEYRIQPFSAQNDDARMEFRSTEIIGGLAFLLSL